MPSTLYDRLAPFYDLVAAPEAPIRRAAVALLAPQPGERVLELGCGTGQALAAITDACGPSGLALGLDLARGMCRRAKRRLRPQHDNGWLVVQGDARDLPVQPGSVDGIISVLTLETLPPLALQATLAGCETALAAEGRLVAASMAADGRGLIHRLYRWAHRRFPSVVDCRPIDLGDELGRAGYAVLRVSRLPLMGLAVTLALARPRRDDRARR